MRRIWLSHDSNWFKGSRSKGEARWTAVQLSPALLIDNPTSLVASACRTSATGEVGIRPSAFACSLAFSAFRHAGLKLVKLLIGPGWCGQASTSSASASHSDICSCCHTWRAPKFAKVPLRSKYQYADSLPHVYDFTVMRQAKHATSAAADHAVHNKGDRDTEQS